MIWDRSAFGGAKIAAILGETLLVYARDDNSDIPFPGMLDLPGGGRAGNESPDECVTRELFQQFGVFLTVERLHYHRAYRLSDGITVSHFFAAYLTEAEVAHVRFGDEGQDWALMPITDFIADYDAVQSLRNWVGDYRAAAAKLADLANTNVNRCQGTARKNPGKA